MTSPTQERLQAAAAAYAEAAARRDSIAQRMRDLQRAADQRRADVQQFEQPRQERRGLIARLLREGREATPEERAQLQALDAALIRAQAGISAASDELSAMADIEAELQQEFDALHPTVQRLAAEADEAMFLAAADEIDAQALPRFLEAAEAFRQAMGELLGVGIAHHQMAERFEAKHGRLPGQARGLKYPDMGLGLVVAGFDIEERLRGHPTLLGHDRVRVRLNFEDPAHKATLAALARWEAAR